MALFVLLFVAALLVQAQAQLPPAVLERLEQFRRAAAKTGDELWPGWNPNATPVALFKGNELGVLMGHPSPPPHFRRVAASSVSAPVFVSDSTEGMARANTAQNFSGALTSFISYPDFAEKPAADALALAMHELFHAHQQRIAPRKFGDILVVLWGKYPEFSARNRALLVLEAQALHRALGADTEEEARMNASGFLGIRAERRGDLLPEVARYESGEESSEGLARYVELRLLQLLAKPDLDPGGAAEAAQKRLDQLKTIHALERDRERFYVLGMAQAALLDRFRPGWKKEFEAGPLLLDELLAQSVPAPSATDTAGMLALLGFRRVFQEQEKAIAERSQHGARRLTALVSAPGERVAVEVGALKNNLGLRGINPNGSVMLGAEQVAHNFLLLDLADRAKEPGTRVKLEFRGVPVVYDRAQDIFWWIMPADTVARAVEQFGRVPASETPRLVLKAEGFSGEFTGVSLDRRPRELRIRPVEDLKRAPALKPPVFVRPDP